MSKRLFFSLLLTSAAVFAADIYSTRPKGYVTDQAHILNSNTIGRIESLLTQFEQTTTVQIAVVTVPSLEGNDISDVSSKLFKTWGIGQKNERGNGVLFLIAPNDCRMRIEVGYGLEGVITDGMAGRIRDEAVIPQFKAGNMDAGVLAGTQILCQLIAQKSNLDVSNINDLSENQHSPNTQPTAAQWIPIFIFLAFVIIVLIKNPWLLLLFISRGRGFGGGSGGFGGGGFGGFGGGSSGGGGASGRW